MPIHSDNLNLNLNLNLGASNGAGGGGVTGYGRPRFNTEDMDKLMPVSPLPTVNLPTLPYDPNWDPELKAWTFVYEFMTSCPWGNISPGNPYTPITYIRDQIRTQPGTPFPIFQVPAPVDGSTAPAGAYKLNDMSDQVVGVYNAALDRADRFTEILDQATGAGALNYWCGMLRLDPVQERNAFMLMLIARKIGEFVAMGLKDVYRLRRPSQVYPFLNPMIDPPDTPSFPSSHSLQAHLISFVLNDALANPIPGFTIAATNYPATYPTGTALFTLADRVARNREIAGVHYAIDSACGAYAAMQCVLMLRQLAAATAPPNPNNPPAGTSYYKNLLALAKAELVDLP